MVAHIAVLVSAVLRVRGQTALALGVEPLRRRMRIHTGDGVRYCAVDSRIAFASIVDGSTVVVVVVVAVIALVMGGRRCALTLGLSLRFGGVVVIAGGAPPFAESDMVSSLVIACCSERARHFVEGCGGWYATW